MKNKILLASGITMLSNSLAIAGGWESSALSTSFLYEKGGENGGYAEVAFGSRDYEITDSATAPNVASAPSSSAVKDQSATTISFKYAVTDEISLGFSRYKQGSIQLDYSGAGSAAAAAGWPPTPTPTPAGARARSRRRQQRRPRGRQTVRSQR